MANEYDYEAGGSGSGFMVGLLTGTVLGAGLGMLFAPKSGSELRGKISESASHVGEKGREMVDRARDEARRLGEKASHITGSSTGSSATGSNVGGSSSPGSSSSNPGSPYSPGPTRG